MNCRFRDRFLLLSLSLLVFYLPVLCVSGAVGDYGDDVCAHLPCICSDGVVECSSMATTQQLLETLRKRNDQLVQRFSCVNCTLKGDNLRLDVPVADVDIAHNGLTNLAAGSDRILNLNVAHNLVASLTFTKYFPHLRRLLVGGNRLTEIPRLKLPSLTVLDVSDNQISDIDHDAFADLSQLTVLNLSGNLLKHLHYEWFTPLRNLRRLNLARNRLSELNNLVFMPLSQLRFVNLSHNRLLHIGLLSFQSVNSLEELDLSHNNLSVIPGDFCKWFHSLRLIDVSANPLTSLANFRSLPTTANFSFVARELRSLKVIHANDTVGLDGMTSLDLTGSGLQSIELASFQRLKRLRTLNLSNCSLSSLPRGLFLPLISLERVNLQGNSWQCDCGLKWLLYFFFHRQQLQLDGPGVTVCSGDTLKDGRSGVHAERLLDFLDRKVQCENATIVNFTRNAQYRLGSTAVLFCEERGLPAPTLTWHSKSSGRLHSCESGCFRESKMVEDVDAVGCDGCRMARWTCVRQLEGCTNDECRHIGQECLHLVETEEASGTCCSGPHLKEAVKVCLEYDHLAKDIECLRDVAALSVPTLLQQNDTRAMEQLNECITMRANCIKTCSSDECYNRREEQCIQPAVTCALEAFSHDSSDTNANHRCQSRICTRGRKLYISGVSRGDSDYYMCRASNVLQTQQVTIHMTLNYNFIQDVKIFSILTGLGIAIIFTIATLIGVAVEKVLQHFGLKCPCDADGPIRRQNIVKILEQVEGYRRQNLERLRENYNWQVARIKENCILQMDRVKDSYIAEQTGKICDYGSSQIGAIKDNYVGQVQRVRDYGNAQMDWLRENYVFQRNRIHKFSKHQLIRLRENYKLQQKHLNKILETLPNLESCRKGFYSETDLRELNFTSMLVPPPPPPESVLEFPTFDEFSLPDVQTGFGSRSGTIISPEGSLVSMGSERRFRRAYPTIEEVIRERLLPIQGAAVAVMDVERRRRPAHKGHRRSYSAPITTLALTAPPPFREQMMEQHLAQIDSPNPQYAPPGTSTSRLPHGDSKRPHNTKQQTQQQQCHDPLCLQEIQSESPPQESRSSDHYHPLMEHSTGQQTPKNAQAEEASRSDSGTDGSQSTAPISDVLVYIELQPQQTL